MNDDRLNVLWKAFGRRVPGRKCMVYTLDDTRAAVAEMETWEDLTMFEESVLSSFRWELETRG